MFSMSQGCDSRSILFRKQERPYKSEKRGHEMWCRGHSKTGYSIPMEHSKTGHSISLECYNIPKAIASHQGSPSKSLMFSMSPEGGSQSVLVISTRMALQE